MNDEVFYFAYGSNLNKRDMSLRCPGSQPVARAKILGWGLNFRTFIDIEPEEGGEVWGAVYLITSKDLDHLDMYEGYPTLYNRFSVETEDDTGERRVALVYSMGTRHSENAPMRHHIDSILQGYADWELDTGPLFDALDRCPKDFEEVEFGV